MFLDHRSLINKNWVCVIFLIKFLFNFEKTFWYFEATSGLRIDFNPPNCLASDFQNTRPSKMQYEPSSWIYLSIYSFIYLSVYLLFIYLFIYLSIYLSINNI